MTSINTAQLWLDTRKAHLKVFEDTFEVLHDDFEGIANACIESIKAGGKILFFGNGGSAADAQHIATELTIRFINDRPAIAAIALTTDTSALTAAGNDYGFDHIFSRQIEALGKPDDIAIGISTSGNSANILNGLITAKAHGLVAVGFGGKDGGKMKPLCDHSLIVPSNTTASIQEMHIVLGHMLCSAIEAGLGYSA